jgi:hypothetical protein
MVVVNLDGKRAHFTREAQVLPIVMEFVEATLADRIANA